MYIVCFIIVFVCGIIITVQFAKKKAITEEACTNCEYQVITLTNGQQYIKAISTE